MGNSKDYYYLISLGDVGIGKIDLHNFTYAVDIIEKTMNSFHGFLFKLKVNDEVPENTIIKNSSTDEIYTRFNSGETVYVKFSNKRLYKITECKTIQPKNKTNKSMEGAIVFSFEISKT